MRKGTGGNFLNDVSTVYGKGIALLIIIPWFTFSLLVLGFGTYYWGYVGLKKFCGWHYGLTARSVAELIDSNKHTKETMPDTLRFDGDQLVETFVVPGEYSKCVDPAAGRLLATWGGNVYFGIPLSEAVVRELAKKTVGVLSFWSFDSETMSSLLESAVDLEISGFFSDKDGSHSHWKPAHFSLFKKHKGALGLYDIRIEDEHLQAVVEMLKQHPGPVWLTRQVYSNESEVVFRKGMLPFKRQDLLDIRGPRAGFDPSNYKYQQR
jgi:hypothetical protein